METNKQTKKKLRTKAKTEKLNLRFIIQIQA